MAIVSKKESFPIPTPLGVLSAFYQDNALVRLAFSGCSDSEDNEAPAIHAQVRSEIDEYFAGDRSSFSIALCPEGTDFQQKIWTLLKEIPYGQTMSYAELSKRYGDLKAIRAIASANGANPIGILIPCHRVIGSDGSLTGYAGGLWRKEALLDLEVGVQRLF